MSKPGDLDTTFGVNGLVTTNFLGDDFGYSLAIQSDGKIILGGYTNTGLDYNFALAKYNTNGSLDTTFGTNGLVTTDFSGNDNQCKSLAIQSDGKIILGGSAKFNNIDNFALARYNSDGSLDETFGTNGLVTTDFSGSYDYGNSLVIQSDGKIILGGRAIIGTYYNFALARYNSDGSLDTTFGTNGLVTTDFSDNTDHGQSLVIQSDGKIILGGSAFISTNYNFALARYNSDGSLDTTFGTYGLVTTDFSGNNDFGQSLAIQSDGKIILGGGANDGTNFNFALARYDTSGNLDTTFGVNGLITTDFSGNNDFVNSLAIQSDDKIILGGGTNNNFALARYNSDGSLDTNFGTNGLVTTDFSGNYDFGNSLAIQSDGKIILGGNASTGFMNDFALARYIVSSSVSYTGSGAPPTISDFSIPTKTYGNSPFSLTAPTSNSSGAFSYTSSNTSVATISESTVTIVGAGSSTITATQDQYAYNGLIYNVYTGYFNDNVDYFSTATIENNGVTLNISSINAGSNGYVPADRSKEYYSVEWIGYFKPNATGNWTFYTNSDDSSLLWIGDTANSGYTISNSLVNNSGLHGIRERSGTITLTQDIYYPIRIQFGENAADDNMIVSFSGPSTAKTTNGSGFYYNTLYSSANIQATLNVGKATPNITFSIANKTFGDADFTLSAPISDSSGAFTYARETTNIEVSGNIVKILGAGTATIKAGQAATSNYLQRTISTTFNIAKANTTLSNFIVPTTRIFTSPFTLTPPTSNRSGGFTYTSSDPTVASISSGSNEVYIKKYGSTVITATQTETANYNASAINATLNINLANFSICFPAGTPVITDQGSIAIEKINPEKNTIRGKKIVAITSTITIEDKIVCIEKDALGPNIPSQKTYISRNHKVLYNKQMIKAKHLIGKVDGVYNKKYNGEILYNVLLETHDKMIVNNLIVETLDPTSVVAQLYNGTYNAEEVNIMIENINDCAKEYKKAYGKMK